MTMIFLMMFMIVFCVVDETEAENEKRERDMMILIWLWLWYEYEYMIKANACPVIKTNLYCHRPCATLDLWPLYLSCDTSVHFFYLDLPTRFHASISLTSLHKSLYFHSKDIWKPWSEWLPKRIFGTAHQIDKICTYCICIVHIWLWRNASSITYH